MEKTYKITKLVVCIILMCASLGTALYFAIIPFVNISTAYSIKAPDSIELYIDGNYKKLIQKEDEAYKEIMDLYNESFTVTKSDLVLGNETITDIKFQTSKSVDKSSGTYLIFVYKTDQTLKEGYTTVIYNNVTIEINNTESMKSTNAYIVDKTANSVTNGLTFKYTSSAKQHKLYKYLNDLV